ncbi:hypothetical protein VV02_06275 [Luteipulveratus mongoliensis]|uniref:HTH araC/xylS-type domain-containing protein n=1 Tax=Luteipulveratus mongoliensis TaxID=571913 RepID=A0A0K1JFR0_9MICO|nr:hypothetical protein VV02_06275 [Luteipulveratus mongoliensis]
MLRPYVQRISGYRMDGFRPGTHIGLPSASLTCVFDLSDGIVLSGQGLQRQQRFSSVFSGLSTIPARIHHDGSQHGIMLYLTPLGLRDLFAMPAAELVDGAVHLSDVIGPEAAALEDRLRSAPGWSCLDILGDALLARLPDRPDDGLAAQVWRRLEATQGAATVADLARESGWSVRHLSGQFTQEMGVGPKTATRLFRFGRSISQVREGGRLADVAARCGYADQAHLAREWREMAGLSPSSWRALEEFTPA